MVFFVHVMTAALGSLGDAAVLEDAFAHDGMRGFMSATLELERKQGRERTAETLAGLLHGESRTSRVCRGSRSGRNGQYWKGFPSRLSRGNSQPRFRCFALGRGWRG